MRRSLALVAATLLVALTAAPALAADPPLAGGYGIRGLEGPDGTLEVDGKLWIDTTSLGVSVGCNTIEAQLIAVEADVVRFGPARTTEMGCQPELAAAEALIARLLGAQELRRDGDALVSPAGRILLVPTTGVDPGPAGSPKPAETTVPIEPVASFSLEQCIGILPDEELAPYGIGPLAGSAGTSTGGGTSGSAGGSASGSGGGVAPEPILVDPVPVESGAVDPAPVEPAPAASAQAPDASAPTASAMPAETPSGIYPLPAPSDAIATDPNGGKPLVDPAVLPAASDGPSLAYQPNAEECRALLSRIRTVGAPTAGMGVPEMAADAVAGAATVTGSDPATSALRVLLVLAAGGAVWLLGRVLARRTVRD